MSAKADTAWKVRSPKALHTAGTRGGWVWFFLLVVVGFVLAKHPVSAAEGEKKWDASLGYNEGVGSPAIGPDGTIYVTSAYASTLWAIRPDGSIKWQLNNLLWSTDPVIGLDGTIYVSDYFISDRFPAGYEAHLRAFNPDGSERWRLAGAGDPAIGENGTIYVGVVELLSDGTISGEKLYALTPDGGKKWSFPLKVGSLAIGGDGTIYVGSGDGLHAIHPNGTKKWVSPIPAGVGSLAIGGDGTIYGRSGGHLLAIRTDGSLKWSSPIGSSVGYQQNPVIGVDGILYVSNDDSLRAVRPADGSNKWVFPMDARRTPAIGSDGILYVGSAAGLHAINPDGGQRWLFPTSTEFNYDGVVSSPTVGSDGTVYVGTLNYLYAITSSSKGLANSSWPMLRHDASHTGRVAAGSTVYEDAEDGTTVGWDIYDPVPAGARIINVYDPVRKSRAIELSGAGTENGYRLRRSRGSPWTPWNNTQQFVLEWSMRYAQGFTVYVDVKTSQSQRILAYTAEGVSRLGAGTTIHHGLGSGVKDGQWHTITRDLARDLREAQPDNTLLSVNGLLIRGSGRVDDISLWTRQERFWREAEWGKLTAPLQAEVTGVGLRFLWAPPGSGTVTDPALSLGAARYTFNVSVSGKYALWLRTLAPSAASNSFFGAFDGGSDKTYTLSVSSTWGWKKVETRSLSAGTHRLTLKHREQGTMVDKLLLTLDPSYVPR